MAQSSGAPNIIHTHTHTHTHTQLVAPTEHADTHLTFAKLAH